ncbi:urea transporter 1 isoform 2-T4 [Spinachia spinachia]
MSSLLLCTGDMKHVDKYMHDKQFVLQLVVWGLRGVARVILANNPLSGALILAALFWASPWQGLLGTLGVLASTLTAVIIGQDSAEVQAGLHGFNGMLVSLLMGVFSSAGPWYWWLLLPVCFGSAICVFLFGGLSSVLDRWDLPVSVFPFNITIVLYLLCTGPDNPYFPHHPASPLGPTNHNGTELIAVEVARGILLGVGQIFACGALWPSLLILGAVLLYSPLQAAHALLGSAVGTMTGLSMAVRHESLYSGMSGFNGSLGCMAVGGLFFTFSWRTHLFAIASAFLSAYADIALSNLLRTVGLPACSWAATLTVTLMLLLTGSLATYRIPMGQVMAPEHNLRFPRQWEAGNTADKESTDV